MYAYKKRKNILGVCGKTQTRTHARSLPITNDARMESQPGAECDCVHVVNVELQRSVGCEVDRDRIVALEHIRRSLDGLDLPPTHHPADQPHETSNGKLERAHWHQRVIHVITPILGEMLMPYDTISAFSAAKRKNDVILPIPSFFISDSIQRGW